MQISTVLKIQGVHIQHYIFFLLLQYLDPWKCRVMWAGIPGMHGCSRAPRSYKLLYRSSYTGEVLASFLSKFCFRLQSLPAMGLLWSKRIGAPHFLAESHDSTGFEALKDEQHTDNSNRYWQTMADKNGRSLLFPSWPWKPCELQWMLSAGGWTEGHWEALIVADWA